MDDLIARLERATGPDREIDARIWAELDQRDVFEHGSMLLARARRPARDTCRLGFLNPGKIARNFSIETGFKPPIPAYTGSIDAALTLVSQEWNVKLERFADSDLCQSFVRRHVDHVTEAHGSWGNEFVARPAAIAICIAALKARAAVEQAKTEIA